MLMSQSCPTIEIEEVNLSKDLFLALALFVPAASVHGAQVYTESFPANAAGWTNGGTGASWAWSSSQDMRVSVGVGSPAVRRAVLVAEIGASGGAFVGNYPTAGITHLGFDYVPETILPNEFFVRLTSSESPDPLETFINAPAFPSLVVGQTNRIVLDLTSLAGGPWLGAASEQQFQFLLGHITRVQIGISLSLAAQAHRLDNIFLDSVPQRAAMTWRADGGLELLWEPLAPSRVYAVEATMDLTEPAAWSNIMDRVMVDYPYFIDPDAEVHPFRAYRLIGE
jgi:hypothetical protein